MKLPIAALAACLAMPAHAQTCAERATVISVLFDEYGETRQSIALDQAQRVVEVYANRETGTIAYTRADGVTCLVASGGAYEATDDAGGEAL